MRIGHGCFKSPHPTIIDGDIWSDSDRFLVGIWGCGTSDTGLARRKLAEKTHPNHGSRHHPTANMLRDKSMSLKLEKIIVFTINLAIKGMAHCWRHRREVPAFGCCNGCRWPTWAGGQCRRLLHGSLAVVSAWRNRGRQ